ETAQRGFALTGDERFLEPLRAAELELPVRFDRLAETTRNDSAMLKRVIDLQAQAEVVLNYLQRVIKVRRERGLKQAAEMVGGTEGKQLMDGIRDRVAGLQGLTRPMISDERATARSQLLRASLTSLVAGVIGIGAGLIALWLSRVTLRHQERERE